MFYQFKIKKNNLEITLASENKELIAQEFGKFAAEFAGVDFRTIGQKNTSADKFQTVPLKLFEQKITQVKNNNTENVTSTAPNALPVNFAKVLAQKTQEENVVVEKKVSELKNAYLQMQNVIREKSLKEEVDYIVSAAYCLSRYEGLNRFTEAQIKAKISPFFDEDLDHNFILDAVAKNYIRVLPDFTGFSDSIEFELTQQGEEYFVNEL